VPNHDEEPDKLLLHARNVQFDWSTLPMHWVPDEPFATHLLNVLHLLLPEGERWFVRTFQEALPLITDDRLHEDVLGFCGQEAVHAEAHDGVLQHLPSKGLNPEPFTTQIEWVFKRILGDRPELTGRAGHEYLVERLAMIAAIEHVTALLGHWILNSPGLDRANCDPTMLDLLRWHGAEEVEHRCVAYDTMQHFDGRYFRRTRAMLIAGPVLAIMWVKGVKFLIANDPELPPGSKVRWRDFFRASRKGLCPGAGSLLKSMARYFRPSYYPDQEGSTAQAVAYLAQSPAARAAH
jgi:predicted metal-dependent hydrolase